jgi:hypothetical protein
MFPATIGPPTTCSVVFFHAADELAPTGDIKATVANKMLTNVRPRLGSQRIRRPTVIRSVQGPEEFRRVLFALAFMNSFK